MPQVLLAFGTVSSGSVPEGAEPAKGLTVFLRLRCVFFPMAPSTGLVMAERGLSGEVGWGGTQDQSSGLRGEEWGSQTLPGPLFAADSAHCRAGVGFLQGGRSKDLTVQSVLVPWVVSYMRVAEPPGGTQGAQPKVWT